jgi:hypothetical protein
VQHPPALHVPPAQLQAPPAAPQEGIESGPASDPPSDGTGDPSFCDPSAGGDCTSPPSPGTALWSDVVIPSPAPEASVDPSTGSKRSKL